MKSQFVCLLIASAALAGCHRGDRGGAAPTGQVAATVAGQEITTSDLRFEMGSVADDPRAQAAAQPAALQAVVNRKILARAATERGLDKTPAAAMQLQRARELGLIALLQQSVVARVPKPSVDEANIYVHDNPQAFAERKLISVDQLLVPQITAALVRQMEPMTTLEQVTQLLDTNKVPYRTGAGVIDTTAIPPEPAKRLAAMNNGFVFLTPAGNGGLQVSRITGSRAAPLTGTVATQTAQGVLYNQRVGQQVRAQFEGIIRSGQSNVQINPAFKAPAATNRPAR